eukprot:scaffold8161_cov430-Prasinococcus_capsulatus_cf.AAC.3
MMCGAACVRRESGGSSHCAASGRARALPSSFARRWPHVGAGQESAVLGRARRGGGGARRAVSRRSARPVPQVASKPGTADWEAAGHSVRMECDRTEVLIVGAGPHSLVRTTARSAKRLGVDLAVTLSAGCLTCVTGPGSEALGA